MNSTIGTVLVSDSTLEIRAFTYLNGNLAIELHDPLEGPYASLTTNLQIHLPRGVVAVKTYSENEHLRTPLLESGLFIDSGVRIPSGFSNLEVWHLSPELLSTIESLTLH